MPVAVIQQCFIRRALFPGIQGERMRAGPTMFCYPLCNTTLLQFRREGASRVMQQTPCCCVLNTCCTVFFVNKTCAGRIPCMRLLYADLLMLYSSLHTCITIKINVYPSRVQRVIVLRLIIKCLKYNCFTTGNCACITQ